MTAKWYQLSHWQLVVGITITSLTWLLVTFFTRPENDETLKRFVRLTYPGGPGWKKVHAQLVAEGEAPIQHRLPLEILCMFIGVFTVYGALFATGFWIYGHYVYGIIFSVVTVIGASLLLSVFSKLNR